MLMEKLKLKKLSNKAKNWGLKTVTTDATKKDTLYEVAEQQDGAINEYSS